MVYDNVYSVMWCVNRKSWAINLMFCVMDCKELQGGQTGSLAWCQPRLCALLKNLNTLFSASFLSCLLCFPHLSPFLYNFFLSDLHFLSSWWPLFVFLNSCTSLLFFSIRWFRRFEQQIWTTLQMEGFPSMCLLSIQAIQILPWRTTEVRL